MRTIEEVGIIQELEKAMGFTLKKLESDMLQLSLDHPVRFTANTAALFIRAAKECDALQARVVELEEALERENLARECYRWVAINSTKHMQNALNEAEARYTQSHKEQADRELCKAQEQVAKRKGDPQ